MSKRVKMVGNRLVYVQSLPMDIPTKWAIESCKPERKNALTRRQIDNEHAEFNTGTCIPFAKKSTEVDHTKQLLAG
jgi:hypothetical protein